MLAICTALPLIFPGIRAELLGVGDRYRQLRLIQDRLTRDHGRCGVRIHEEDEGRCLEITFLDLDARDGDLAEMAERIAARVVPDLPERWQCARIAILFQSRQRQGLIIHKTHDLHHFPTIDLRAALATGSQIE